MDASGNAYVTGYTGSSDFPWTAGAYDTEYNGNSDAFVTKLNPSGSTLVYSTFLGGGGPDYGYGIAVDTVGCAYVIGDDDGYNDVFVVKLNASGSSLVCSTLVGGNQGEEGFGIAVDASGCAYVTGDTVSSNFPTTADAYDRTYNGGTCDAFVTKLGMGQETPEVVAVHVQPASVPNDGTTAARVTASLTDPDSLGDIASVRVALSPLGSDPERGMNDEGDDGDLAAGDGVYTCLVSVNDAAITGSKVLIVTATDVHGLTATGQCALNVTAGQTFNGSYEKTVGILRVKCNTGFQPAGTNRWRATGLCSIGTTTYPEVLMLDGEVLLDQTSGSLVVSGSGKVYVPDVYLLGTVVLYEGEFSFDAATGATKGLNKLCSLLRVGGMKVEVTTLKLTQSLDGVVLSGKIELPKSLGSVKVDVGQFTISKNAGVDIDATVNVASLPIPGTSWALKDVTVHIDTYTDTYSGEGSLSLPGLFDVDGSFLVLNGTLDSLSAEVSGFSAPIDATPLSLTELAGSVTGLSRPPAVITASARVSLALTSDLRLLDVNGEVEVGLAGYVKGTLTVTYLVSEGAIEFDGFELGQLDGLHWQGGH